MNKKGTFTNGNQSQIQGSSLETKSLPTISIHLLHNKVYKYIQTHLHIYMKPKTNTHTYVYRHTNTHKHIPCIKLLPKFMLKPNTSVELDG